MSDDDIAPGTLWFGEISKKIQASTYGVICVTQENLQAPWLLWEAGALYGGWKDAHERIVPFLIDVDKAELRQGPLGQFQVVDAKNRTEVTRMLTSINGRLADPVPDEILANQINYYWGELQDGIAAAIRAHPVVKDPDTGRVRTFQEAAECFLEEKRGSQAYQGYEQALKHVGPYINRLPLSAVDSSALAQFKRDRRQGTIPVTRSRGTVRPAMVGTINKELQTVAMVLRWAVEEWRWMDYAPPIRYLPRESKSPYILSWEEQDRLVACHPPYARAAVEFAVNTGMKRSEIRDLRWSQLRRYEKRNTDYFVVPLGRRFHKNVVLNSIAKGIVAQQRGKNDEFVFTSRKGQQYRTYGGRTWIRAWEQANLPTDEMRLKGVENLRHTFGHRLRAVGVPQEDIDMLMGSTTAHVRQRLSQPEIGNLIDHVEKIVDRNFDYTSSIDYAAIRAS